MPEHPGRFLTAVRPDVTGDTPPKDEIAQALERLDISQVDRSAAAKRVAESLESRGFDFRRTRDRLRSGDLQVENPQFFDEVMRIGTNLQEGKFAGFVDATLKSTASRLSAGQLHFSPEEALSKGASTAAHITGDLLGIGIQLWGVTRLLGAFSALPRVANITEQIAPFVRRVLRGGTAFAVIEATRPEGMPEDPGALDVSARVGQFFEPLLGERGGLAVGGFVLGAAFDGIIGGIAKGVKAGWELNANRSLPDILVPEIQRLLKAAGVEVPEGASKFATIRLLKENQSKFVVPESMAQIMAEIDGRMQYVAQGLLDNPQTLLRNVDEASVYVLELLRANPGGLSVAKNATLGRVQEVADALGIQVILTRHGKNVAIHRMQISGLPEFTKGMTKEGRAITKLIKAQGEQEPIINFFRNGSRVDGTFDAGLAVRQLKLKVPEVAGVPRPDLVVRQRVGLVQVTLSNEGKAATIDFPTNITRQQLDATIRLVEREAHETVIINGIKQGKKTVLKNPLGFAVEDAIVKDLPGIKRVGFVDQIQALNQFGRDGVFKGQLGILSETGYAVEVIKKTSKGRIQVRDPFGGKPFFVDPNKIGLLPTTLEGNLTPNRLLLKALSPKDQALRLRAFTLSTKNLLAPPTRYADLETFASSRGYDVTNLGKGAVQLHHFASGESQKFATLKSASMYIRNRQDAVPDLTPPEIIELLGGRTNIGMGGAFSHPPARVQERMPARFDAAAMEEMLAQRRPGTAQSLRLAPTKRHFANIDRFMLEKHGVDLGLSRTFLDIDAGIGHRQNFLSGWVRGKGPHLPAGVTPLEKIRKRAGKDADWEMIQNWLEARALPASRLQIEGQMTAREIEAAKEMGIWYDNLLKDSGFSTELLTDYFPHIKRWGESYGGDIEALFRKTRNIEAPADVKALKDWFVDGAIDIYEVNAFTRALQFTGTVANKRFMKEPMDKAYKLLREIPDNGLKKPLSDYLEAIAGIEFRAQKAVVENTLREMFRGIGITVKDQGFFEKLGLNLLGFGYSATMAFRPGLVIRNLTQTFQTTWTLFGGSGDLLLQAMGRAGTRAGRNDAVLDAAIKMKTGGVPFSEEIALAQEGFPVILKQLSELSMKLYNGADSYNRAVAYWTGRLRATEALGKYTTNIQKGMAGATAKDKLMVDSGLFAMDKAVQDKFFQLLASSPDQAARFFGKNAADITQWLYGRGNQIKFLRVLGGRFLGQFATWPVWYFDFVTRTTGNMIRSGHPGEAIKFLGRLGIANASVGLAGSAVGISLWKWAGVTSMFYNGGPAFEVLDGLRTLVRGFGDAIFNPDDPFGQSRMTEGRRVLGRVGQAFIPFRYIAKDITDVMAAGSPKEFIAEVLGTTEIVSIEDQIAAFDDLGNLSTDWRVWEPNSPPTVAERNRQLRLLRGDRERIRVPVPGSSQGPAGQSPGGARSPQPPLGSGVKFPQPIPGPGETLPPR